GRLQPQTGARLDQRQELAALALDPRIVAEGGEDRVRAQQERDDGRRAVGAELVRRLGEDPGEARAPRDARPGEVHALEKVALRPHSGPVLEGVGPGAPPLGGAEPLRLVKAPALAR